MRNNVQYSLVRAAIVRSDEHQNVLGRDLCVLHENVEVAVLVEHAGVEQLKLRLVSAAAVFLHQPAVRKFRLRILVEHFQVRVRRRGIEGVVQLLYVLTVISLGIGQAEKPLLEDRVLTVPKCRRQA